MLFNHRAIVLPLTILASVAALGSGCGQNVQFVRDVAVSSFQQNGDAYGEIKATLDTGAVQLPNFTLPIFNPVHPGVIYGTLGMSPTPDGFSDLKIDLDITLLDHVPAGSALLPNGNPLPVSGLASQAMLTFPVGGSGAQVYVAVNADWNQSNSTQLAMVGAAIPFREFDQLGQNVGNTGLFFPFSIQQVGLKGTAGVFTGKQPGTSGVGFFVDVSGLLKYVHPQAGSRMALFQRVQSAPAPQLSFPDVSPGGRKEYRIKSTLYQMHEDEVQLNLL